jgi:2-oxoglutarate/2-oxoacid ferredoxin oxidoreductase subunit beta
VSCSIGCSLLEARVEDDERVFGITDYEGALARWCAGCGDHSVLTAMQRLLAAEQLQPEQTVFVSGIGCSSRFPHYMKTYGFHGIHGRALPVATGVKLQPSGARSLRGDGRRRLLLHRRRALAARHALQHGHGGPDAGQQHLRADQEPDLADHAAGLPEQHAAAGQLAAAAEPARGDAGDHQRLLRGADGGVDPGHLYATLQAAYRHRGFAFVRILQRCPEFTPKLYADAVRKPDMNEFLVHDDGVMVPELEKSTRTAWCTTRATSTPRAASRRTSSVIRLGVFFRDESRPRYEETRRLPCTRCGEAEAARTGARPLCRLTIDPRGAGSDARPRERFRAAVAAAANEVRGTWRPTAPPATGA